MYTQPEPTFEDIVSHESALDDDTELYRAQEIVAEHRYQKSLHELREHGLLAGQIERVKVLYTERLSAPQLALDETDWEMLTILDLYDTETTAHSVRVFENALAAISEPLLMKNGEQLDLPTYLAEEGVSVTDFLHAALFHDIGKLIIPHRILNDTTTHADMQQILTTYLVTSPDRSWLAKVPLSDPNATPTEIIAALREQHIRTLDIVPLSALMTTEEFVALQQACRHITIIDSTTMGDILNLHEAESRLILEEIGMHIPATIAGQHHNYANEPLVYPRATSTLRINRNAANVLHLADVSDAIRNPRSYKGARNELTVLTTLVDDVEAGKIDPLIAHAWINTQFLALHAEQNSEADTTQTTQVQRIARFLDQPIITTNTLT